MKKNIYMIIGTPYFVSYPAAVKYYKDQYSGYTKQDIDNKLENNEIFIGKPKIDKDETLSINDGRYHITSYK